MIKLSGSLTVRTNSTVDPDLLRQQVIRLKKLGYEFKPLGRIFVKADQPGGKQHGNN